MCAGEIRKIYGAIAGAVIEIEPLDAPPVGPPVNQQAVLPGVAAEGAAA